MHFISIYKSIWTIFKGLKGYVFLRHVQQYFRYIVAFSFIGGGIFPGHLGSPPDLVGFDLGNLLFSLKCFVDLCL